MNQTPETEQSTTNYLSFLSIIHLALLGGQISFGVTAFVLDFTGFLDMSFIEQESMLMVAVTVLVFSSLLGSSFLFKTKLNGIRQKESLQAKLAAYRSLLIIKFALLEIPSFFALVCFILTGEVLFIGLAGLVVIAFVFNRPTRFTITKDLELSKKEQEVLDGSTSSIA